MTMLPGDVKNHHMCDKLLGVTKLPDVRVTSSPKEIKKFRGLGGGRAKKRPVTT